MSQTPVPTQLEHLEYAKTHFLAVYEKELATTLRVLRSYPEDQGDFKPHDRSMTARQLAWLLVMEQAMTLKALTTGFDWSQPFAPPPPPGTMGEIIEALESKKQEVISLVQNVPPAQLGQTVSFFVAPKTLGDVSKRDFIWMFLFDHIHHRGQLSVYLRMVGGKVPSIYGPSADEPWR